MNRPEFIAICKKSQSELKSYLKKRLKKKYPEVKSEFGFLFAKGELPVLLVAHLDTVHTTLPVNVISEVDKIYSPQGIGGDDRCGVYEILQIINTHKCSVLFCEDEEKGASGSKDFLESEYTKDFKPNYIIELDRMGNHDAVFYDCDNQKFTDFIVDDGDWTENFGSFSDISYLAPGLGVAAVNLSSGYYKAHTKDEYVVPSEMDDIIRRVKKLLDRTTDADKYEYIEASYLYDRRMYGYRYDGYNGYSYRGYNTSSRAALEGKNYYFFTYTDDSGVEDYGEAIAENIYEAMGMFFEEHENVTYNMVTNIEYLPAEEIM